MENKIPFSNLKVNTYVRTINQGIKRIDTIFKEKTTNKYGYETCSDFEGTEYSLINIKNIRKASKNLIDLIEAGDLVNEYIIDGIYLNGAVSYLSTQSLEGVRIYINDIKTIVTKEQLKQIEYRVEE